MKWVDNIMEKVKGGIRSWLNVQPANPSRINITETLDYEANAIKKPYLVQRGQQRTGTAVPTACYQYKPAEFLGGGVQSRDGDQ